VRRRKTTNILCVCLITAAVTAGGLLTWPTSDLENSKGLEIEYLTEEKIAEPPVIQYETGKIERTEEIMTYNFTSEEKEALEKIAIAEAENQGSEGMWLVMSTVINRMTNKEWPNTVLEVINERHKTKSGRIVYQFQSVSNGRFNRAKINKESEEALSRIEHGEVAPEIVAFERTDSDALDKYFARTFEFKDHRFYTQKK
jgi:N-acetylmuramoyl-L-alanine amidase